MTLSYQPLMEQFGAEVEGVDLTAEFSDDMLHEIVDALYSHSVLLFHGLKDTALLHPMLNNTWMWVDKDLTLVTIPDAGHNAQSDAADLVTRTMVRWLGQ